MQYLVGQMSMCLLLAGLLGVVLGWAWWGTRLRQSRERTTDLEQRVSKLTGYPARLTDMEATHAAYVASKNEEEAKFKARIAELEPFAAKVPELQQTLAAKTTDGDVLRTQLTALQAKFDEAESQHKASLTSSVAKDAVIAEHVQAHQDKDARLASLTGRIAELEPAAAKAPLLEEQISHHIDAHKEKDEHLEQLMSQVDELKAAHNVKDSRIAELAPLAALVPGLQSDLESKNAHVANLSAEVEQRTSALAEQDLRLEDMSAQVEQYKSAHAEKDARISDLASQVDEHAAKIEELAPLAAKAAQGHTEEHIAELVAAAALVPALKAEVEQHAAAHAEKDAKIADLAPLAAMVPHLNSHIAELTTSNAGALAEKDSRIGELEPLAAMVPQLHSHIEQLTNDHTSALAEKDAKIGELEPLAAMVPHLNAHIQQLSGDHTSALAEKDAKIGELEPLAAMVPHLNAHIQQLTGDHTSALAEKDAKIGELEPLAAMVPHLNAHVAQITSDLKSSDAPEHVAELAATAALVPMLKAEIDQHVSAHAQKDEQIGALLGRVEELQPVAANYTDLQYAHGLTSRKLHMAESAIAAHQAEISNLNQQLLTHKAEHPVAETAAQPRSMAAAAGAGTSNSAPHNFYDVNEGAPSAPSSIPEAQTELQKRIEELRTLEAAKDAEIANLRSKIAEIEKTPDPDVKRQILFTAKNAEVTHLKGVLNTLLQPLSKDDIALRAFTYAKDRGFSGGSENEDWLRAERDIHHSRLVEAWESTRGGGTLY